MGKGRFCNIDWNQVHLRKGLLEWNSFLALHKRLSAICLVIPLSMSNVLQILNLISLMSQNRNSLLKANDFNAYVLGDVTCGGDKLMYSCWSIGGNLAIGSIGVSGSTNSANSSGESSVGNGGRLSGLTKKKIILIITMNFQSMVLAVMSSETGYHICK